MIKNPDKSVNINDSKTAIKKNDSKIARFGLSFLLGMSGCAPGSVTTETSPSTPENVPTQASVEAEVFETENLMLSAAETVVVENTASRYTLSFRVDLSELQQGQIVIVLPNETAIKINGESTQIYVIKGPGIWDWTLQMQSSLESIASASGMTDFQIKAGENRIELFANDSFQNMIPANPGAGDIQLSLSAGSPLALVDVELLPQ